MKTTAELEKAILDITMKINTEYPELTTYINEIPVIIPAKDKIVISSKNLEEYYNSLVELVKNYATTHLSVSEKDVSENITFSGYPPYPPSEDMYNQGIKEMEMNPNDLSKNKTPNEEEGQRNEKGFKDDMSGGDLDIPGSELDDQQESVGSEDEENNYYSLGGDAHTNLEEDNG